jgi:hypothetical protein
MTAKMVTALVAASAAGAWAYYAYAPVDPLYSFDHAREETPHAIRADGHIGYGYAGGYFDAGGGFVDQAEATTLFAGVVKLGWTFDRTWEADVVFAGANFHNPNNGDFDNGLGDVWLVGKAAWYTKRGGEFRLGPRLGIRFPSEAAKSFYEGNSAVDVAAVGYYDRRGGVFQLDAQLGFRHDMDNDAFAEGPGPSAYFLADPAWALGDEERWLAGASVGTYAGLGTVKTALLWVGPRLQYVIDRNVRLEAGAVYPLAGKSYRAGAYRYPVPRYATVYLGVQSVIPTPW